MADYLMLMHNDPIRSASEHDWETYLRRVEALLAGNPVFENGGTVELRELPKGI